MVLGIVLHLVGNLERLSEFTVFVSPLVQLLLIVGLLKGSEGVRNLLMIGAFIGLSLSAMALLAGLGVMGRSAGVGGLVLFSGTLGVASNGFMLYALNDTAVQAWMLKRSMGGLLDDEDEET